MMPRVRTSQVTTFGDGGATRSRISLISLPFGSQSISSGSKLEQVTVADGLVRAQAIPPESFFGTLAGMISAHAAVVKNTSIAIANSIFLLLESRNSRLG